MTETRDPCSLFLDRLNGALDGDAPVDTLATDAHALACETCRARLAAAKMLAAYHSDVPALPVHFATSVSSLAFLAERSQRRQRRIVQTICALAASFLLAIGLWQSLKPTPVNPAHAAPELAHREGVIKPLNEARDAALSLSSKLADETLSPAANLLTVKAKPVETPVAASPLKELPEAAKAGFEPLVSTPRRALNLFIRDVGGAAGRKVDS